MISVVLSAYNESGNPFFWKTLDTISMLKKEGFPIEVLVGAGESTDTTLEELKQKMIDPCFVKGPMRARRWWNIMPVVRAQIGLCLTIPEVI